MPQASEELQKEWMSGDEPSDHQATKYLEDIGYTLLRNWHWKMPTPDHKPLLKERSAIQFLIDEWDFGGIVG